MPKNANSPNAKQIGKNHPRPHNGHQKGTTARKALELPGKRSSAAPRRGTKNGNIRTGKASS